MLYFEHSLPLSCKKRLKAYSCRPWLYVATTTTKVFSRYFYSPMLWAFSTQKHPFSRLTLSGLLYRHTQRPTPSSRSPGTLLLPSPIYSYTQPPRVHQWHTSRSCDYTNITVYSSASLSISEASANPTLGILAYVNYLFCIARISVVYILKHARQLCNLMAK